MMIKELSEEQIVATKFIDGPAMVLAVPGAGKTTMLMHRTNNLIKSGVNPKRILTITFSKASSLDMKNKYFELFEKNDVEFSTIHAFCYRILNYHARLRGLKYNLLESMTPGKQEILKIIYRNVNGKTPTDEILESLLSDISYVKNMCINPEALIKTRGSEIAGFKEIFTMYENYKRSKNQIDFDDMITKSYEILTSDSDVLRKVRNNFDYYQLDEGQDTSYAQFRILELISKPKNNLFVVLDDDQAIYGFRGANVEEVLKFKERLNPKIFKMQKNYRSQKSIIDCANKFIVGNKERFEKKIEATHEMTSPVYLVKVKNRNEQFKFICDKLDEKKSAVLYRNNAQVLGLVEYFERAGIAFNIKDTRLRFYSNFIFIDIINILDFSEDPSNYKLLFSFYYKIKGYISKKQMEFIKNRPAKNLISELLKFPGLPGYYKENFYELLSDFNYIRKKTIHHKISHILYDMKYVEYMKSTCKRNGSSIEEAKEFVDTLLQIAKEETDYESFIGRLKYLDNILKCPTKKSTNLTFSTMHSAKGLEFDRVFIIDLTSNIMPSERSIERLNRGEYKDYEEERRLFYVAITRAKEELYLMEPGRYLDSNTRESEFMTEVRNKQKKNSKKRDKFFF